MYSFQGHQHYIHNKESLEVASTDSPLRKKINFCKNHCSGSFSPEMRCSEQKLQEQKVAQPNLWLPPKIVCLAQMGHQSKHLQGARPERLCHTVSNLVGRYKCFLRKRRAAELLHRLHDPWIGGGI